MQALEVALMIGETLILLYLLFEKRTNDFHSRLVFNGRVNIDT
jgi:hypothetical protein